MPNAVAEFMRYSAPDPADLACQIEIMRSKLVEARASGNLLAVVDHVADLGSMLTTARLESEAVKLMQEHELLAESHPSHEPSGWFWNSLATALQYAGHRELADKYFERAVQISRASAWQQLLAQALHHWARSLAEQHRFVEAEQRLQEALAIRVSIGEPRQSSTRNALDALTLLRHNHAQGAA
jgi:tetratricopeptide (TPR) repeat protein